MIFYILFVFFFQEYSRLTGQQGKGKATSLTSLYHFHTLHRHLDVGRAITARAHLSTQLAAGIKPRTVGFRVQVSNHLAKRIQNLNVFTNLTSQTELPQAHYFCITNCQLIGTSTVLFLLILNHFPNNTSHLKYSYTLNMSFTNHRYLRDIKAQINHFP